MRENRCSRRLRPPVTEDHVQLHPKTEKSGAIRQLDARWFRGFQEFVHSLATRVKIPVINFVGLT